MIMGNAVAEPSGQGWAQILDLLIAFGLSSIVGLERQLRGKSAGLRTQAIVGAAAALLVLVSKYGFSDVLASRLVVLDQVRYRDGEGVLRELLRRCTDAGWTVVGMASGGGGHGSVHDLLDSSGFKGLVTVTLQLRGDHPEAAAPALGDVEGVESVRVISRDNEE